MEYLAYSAELENTENAPQIVFVNYVECLKNIWCIYNCELIARCMHLQKLPKA